jgi:gliding motility-associated-like protein
LNWYDVATGGTALATTTALSTGTYYVTQTLNTCESIRTAVAVTINTTPAPTASAQAFCNSATVADLVATGTALNWYDVATGGTALATTTALSTGTYYVTQTLNTCESIRTAVAIAITTQITGTISYSSPICKSNTQDQLVLNSTTAPTGGSYTSNPNQGLSLNGTTGAITPSTSNSGNYDVTYTVLGTGGCPNFNTHAQVTIIPQSAIDFQSGCDATIYKLVAVPGTFNPVGATYSWSGPSFSVLPGTPNAIKVNTIGQYAVEVHTADGCVADRTFDVTSVTCEIQKGISPNGANPDFDLTALNVKKIEIFNRYGTSVYSLENYTTQWHGQANGGLALPAGTYFYVVEKADGVTITGWVYINI